MSTAEEMTTGSGRFSDGRVLGDGTKGDVLRRWGRGEEVAYPDEVEVGGKEDQRSGCVYEARNDGGAEALEPGVRIRHGRGRVEPDEDLFQASAQAQDGPIGSRRPSNLAGDVLHPVEEETVEIGCVEGAQKHRLAEIWSVAVKVPESDPAVITPM